jgi:transposase
MQSVALIPNLTIGLDLGDRISRTCEVDANGTVVKRAGVATSRDGIGSYFEGLPSCRVAMEPGTHSPWVSQQLAEMGHEVIVSNSGEVYGKRRRRKRNDEMDAEFLARQGRADVALLHPIRHRGPEAQADLALIRARDPLVGARTKLINHVRGSVKSMGFRLKGSSSESFARQVRPQIPAVLAETLEPLLEAIEELTVQPRHQPEVRSLVSAAHYILGPFGPDCDLRFHGERLAERGGKNAKKRAAVAVARKLAVVMHRLWMTGAAYDPNHLARRSAA